VEKYGEGKLCYKTPNQLRVTKQSISIRHVMMSNDRTFESDYMWLGLEGFENIIDYCPKEQIVASVKVTKDEKEVVLTKKGNYKKKNIYALVSISRED
jgi:hypothetical protein